MSTPLTQTTPLEPVELARAFNALTPNTWNARAFTLARFGSSDSVAFVRKAQRGTIGVSLRLHVATRRLSIEPMLARGYFYAFMTACQKAVWEWTGYMNELTAASDPLCYYVRAPTPEQQTVAWQRMDGVSYVCPIDTGFALHRGELSDELAYMGIPVCPSILDDLL